ncbi:hypothetical protein RS9916_26049 [Synechococcus sp. RS9916]|nr:hypothetical protein RS9916_26049 [Synechococcus sp. RS9916]
MGAGGLEASEQMPMGVFWMTQHAPRARYLWNTLATSVWRSSISSKQRGLRRCRRF